MKKFLERGCGFLFIGMIMIFLTGCTTTEKIADSLSQKNLNVDGVYTSQKIGFDTVNKIPTLESTVITGTIQAIRYESNYFNYRRTTSSSWFNADVRSETVSLTMTASNAADFAELLRYGLAISNSLSLLAPEHLKSELNDDGSYTLKWSKVPGAVEYEVDMSFDRTFAKEVKTVVVRDTEFVIADTPVGTVYWRVTAKVDGQLSPWSKPATFTVDPPVKADTENAEKPAEAPTT